MNYYKIVALLFIILVYKSCFTSNNADSLMYLLKTKPETEHAGIYNDLTLIYSDSLTDLAIDYANKAVELSKKYDQKNNLAYALMNLGGIYFEKEDYKNALKYFYKSIPLAKKKEAYENMYIIYNNVGIIYHNTNEIELALEYYDKALKYANKLNNEYNVMRTLNNIGNVYILKEDFNKSLEYFNKAIEIAKTNIELASDLASIYNNIGWIYEEKMDYCKALEKYKNAFQIFDSLNAGWGKEILLNNIALIYIKLGRFDEAEKNIRTSDSLNIITGQNKSRKNLYAVVYNLYKSVNQYDKAIDYLNKYYQLKDSIYSKELDELILDLKLDALKTEAELKDVKLKQQKTLIFLLSVILIILIIFATILLKLIRDKNKLTKKISIVNKDISEKNRLIHENLEYAKQIQLACMNDNKIELSNINYFVLNLPLNIVGGDFYMARNANNSHYFILADCTGHGISGGFLSLLAIQYIDIAITKFSNPSQIIEYLNNCFYNYFTTNSELANESLTISIVRIIEDKVIFSGSKQRVWHYNYLGVINEYRGDNTSIGSEINIKFSESEIKLKKDELIYLSSDGYPDQFGGENNKKMKYPKFKEVITKASKIPINNQKEFFADYFNIWKSKNSQTDDVLIMGIKYG